MHKWILPHILFAFFTGLLSAALPPKPSQEPRTVHAVRTDTPIRVDGVLKEKIWNRSPVTDFIQSQPDDGKPASERSEVWVAFDKDALYVAARLHDREPERIVRRLGRRDDWIDSDWFTIAVDPYNDGRSGFKFAINPAGCIRDWALFDDEDADSTWDGVWNGAVRVDDGGWSVEIRIPFHQLRFRAGDEHPWGIYFQRDLQRRNEVARVTWIPREESGFVSRFSRLVGIRGIRSGKKVELMPYMVGKAAYTHPDAQDPFNDGSTYGVKTGLDARIGLLSNLTLNLTVNPDFGQVEVDPAQINLSAAETYYHEKRPFFVEGANIFRFGVSGANRYVRANWPEPTFFYSRRIGRSPQYSPEVGDYVDAPDATTILAAAKLTGKLGRGWNLGMVHAVTQKETAAVAMETEQGNTVVEPFTYYGVFRLVREFADGRHGLGVIGSAVIRDLEEDHLDRTLMRQATMIGLDGWTFIDPDRMWSLSGWWGGTRVTGSADTLSALQQGYPYYFQRPDAGHLQLDPALTALTGWSGRIMINKQKGNFLFNVALGAISPGFDIRDLGFQWETDLINGHIMAGYRSFRVGRLLRYWELEFLTQRNYNFAGVKTADQVLGVENTLQFVNYWYLNMKWTWNATHFDPLRTRGGVIMQQPRYSTFEAELGSDSRRSVVAGVGGALRWGEDGSSTRRVSASLELKAATNVSLFLEPQYIDAFESAQWVANIGDPLMIETSGARHLFGSLQQHTAVCDIRLNWIFSPRISFQAYLQPYISVGSYSEFKELARAASFEFNRYGEGESTLEVGEGTYRLDPDGPGPGASISIRNPDFNYKSLRGTMVLRWEYSPGSEFFLVWTQMRVHDGNPGVLDLSRDLSRLFRSPGDNILMMKVTYRFNL